jgi:two-component system, NarL family, response regulator LiaR
METVSVRVVLGEDHALVREGTRTLLEEHTGISVVGEAGDGDAVLALIREQRPDVAILDIRMPGMSGIEVLKRLATDAPDTKALMLTAYDDDDYIVAALDAGAVGFMLKTARSAELVDAVRRVQQGEPVLHPAIAVKVARLWSRSRGATEAPQAEELSARELEVLKLIATGLRNRAIAEQLGISVRTVEGHINNILGKLGVSSRIEAVLYAAAKHWVLLDEDDSR